jgi:integrase-related protein
MLVINKKETLFINRVSFLLAQGVSVKAISTRLGHSNISITMDLYSHIYESTNRELANNFDVFLKTN